MCSSGSNTSAGWRTSARYGLELRYWGLPGRTLASTLAGRDAIEWLHTTLTGSSTPYSLSTWPGRSLDMSGIRTPTLAVRSYARYWLFPARTGSPATSNLPSRRRSNLPGTRACRSASFRLCAYPAAFSGLAACYVPASGPGRSIAYPARDRTWISAGLFRLSCGIERLASTGCMDPVGDMVRRQYRVAVRSCRAGRRC